MARTNQDYKEQKRQIKRVKIKIEDLVLRFCRENDGQVVDIERLEGYVRYNYNFHVAPGSPARILRLLKAQGKVDYEVINRSKSLYFIQFIGGDDETNQRL